MTARRPSSPTRSRLAQRAKSRTDTDAAHSASKNMPLRAPAQRYPRHVKRNRVMLNNREKESWTSQTKRPSVNENLQLNKASNAARAKHLWPRERPPTQSATSFMYSESMAKTCCTRRRSGHSAVPGRTSPHTCSTNTIRHSHLKTLSNSCASNTRSQCSK